VEKTCAKRQRRMNMESLIRDMLKYAEDINPQSTDTDLRSDLRKAQLDMVGFIGQILSELAMGSTSPRSWMELGAKLATEWNEGTLDINMDNCSNYMSGVCQGQAAYGEKYLEFNKEKLKHGSMTLSMCGDYAFMILGFEKFPFSSTATPGNWT